MAGNFGKGIKVKKVERKTWCVCLCVCTRAYKYAFISTYVRETLKYCRSAGWC